MTRRKLLRKAVRIAGYVGLGLVVLIVVIAVGAPIYFRGDRFGNLVERALPAMRGHTHVGGGHWSWGTVIDLVRGRPAALELEDVTVLDPESTEVLHVDRLAARVEVHRQPTHIIIHDLQLSDVRWRFATLAKEKKVGFIAAFESIKKAARKPVKAPGAFWLSITGARLEHVEATFDLSTWGLTLRDVNAIGALTVKGNLFTWEVKDADVRGGGRLRILGEKMGIVLPYERGRLDRVATDADDPDSIHLTANGVVTGASRTSGSGVFTGIYGISPASKHSGIEFDAHIENAADAANAVAANRVAANRGVMHHARVGGKAADLRLHFSQPFDRVAIDARARGFDVSAEDLEARDIGVSHWRYAPGFRAQGGHRHREQEEAYLVVSGSGEMLLDGEVIELRQWDLVRVDPEVLRAFAAGPDGMEIVAVGGPKPEGGDGEQAEVSWP